MALVRSQYGLVERFATCRIAHKGGDTDTSRDDECIGWDEATALGDAITIDRPKLRQT